MELLNWGAGGKPIKRFNDSTIKHPLDSIGHNITKGGIALLLLMGDDVLLAEISYFDYYVRHKKTVKSEKLKVKSGI